MIRIDYEDYLRIGRWIEKANNFVAVRSDPCGDNQYWYVSRGGREVKVLEKIEEELCHTSVSPEFYRVDEDVYNKWKEEFGYTI